ncbi:hypothetical protein EL26_20870 [Tumebacillus flagellatus]|uniref:Uncharacterized protein n=1 Tax=Tumebacillus flagellatus TaxID=1157490 RepID=A0A074LGM9_9BACL|nr:hypothetical protein EL26_20870 [Tumebacillus flagellatus]
MIEYVKGELEKFRTDKAGLKWNFDAYVQAYVQSDADESKLTDIANQIQELEEMREVNFRLVAKNMITDEEYVTRNAKLQEQLQELMNEQNKHLQQEQNLKTTKLKFDTFLKYLEEVDVENLTNTVLRQLVSSISVRTRKRPFKNEFDKEILIEWRFLDKTEGEVFWDSEEVRHEIWERDHWYRGMSPEQIEEEKERERLMWELGQEEAEDKAVQEAYEEMRRASLAATEKA